MKKTILILIFVFGISILNQSCKNDSSLNSTKNTIYVTINTDDTYEYDLGYFGDEEGAYISKQAKHFQVIEIERIIASGKVIYTYQPIENYVGIDEVEIKSERGSDGATPNDDIITTLIKFTITK